MEWHGKYLGYVNEHKNIVDNLNTNWTGKNFENIEASPTEVGFAKQVGTFLKELSDDASRHATLARNLNGAKTNAEKALTTINMYKIRYGADVVDNLLWSNPQFRGEKKVDLEAADRVFKLHKDISATYLQRVDAQAAKWIKAWDANDDGIKTQAMFDAVSGVLGLLGGLAYGGSAAARIISEPMKSTIDLYDRGGGLIFGGSALHANLGKNITANAGEVVKAGNQAEGNLKALVDRFNKWVEEWNKAPPDPNPFIPV